MGIGGKFLKLWRKHFTVISTSAYSVVLVVVEHSMDLNFKCPEGETGRHFYSFCYIVLPAVVLFLLGMVVQLPSQRENLLCCESNCCAFWVKPTDGKMEKCKRIFIFCVKAVVPALLWIIIVLLDGKYIDCAFKSPQTNSNADNSQLGLTPYHGSQLGGLWTMLALALFAFAYWCSWNCCRKRVTMNVYQSRGRLQVQAADYLDKQQNEAIRKLIEKHLNNHYLATPESFVTGLSDETVSFEIRRALNVLWENQGPADGTQSTAGVAESAGAGAENAGDGDQNRTGGAESAGDGAESAGDGAESAGDGDQRGTGGAESAGDGDQAFALERIQLLTLQSQRASSPLPPERPAM